MNKLIIREGGRRVDTVCPPKCGLEDICPVCDPALNAHVGKSRPAWHAVEEEYEMPTPAFAFTRMFLVGVTIGFTGWFLWGMWGVVAQVEWIPLLASLSI